MSETKKRAAVKHRMSLAIAFLLALASFVRTDASGANPLCPRQSEPVVGLSGTHLTLNGKMWVPRGLHIRGFVAPFRVAQDNAVAAVAGGGSSDNAWQKIVDAQKAFGAAEFAAARSWGGR